MTEKWFYIDGRKVYTLNVILTNGKYKIGKERKLYITAKNEASAEMIASNLNYSRNIADKRNEDGSIDVILSE